jgi:hypothetical protein
MQATGQSTPEPALTTTKTPSRLMTQAGGVSSSQHAPSRAAQPNSRSLARRE